MELFVEHEKKYSNSFVSQVAVKSSVLNPLLWLCAVAGILFLSAAYAMPDYRGELILLAIIPFLVAVVYYAYFAHTDPNRLQSEEFQTRQQELLLASKKQSAIPFAVDAQEEDHSPAALSRKELESPDVPLLLDNKASEEEKV